MCACSSDERRDIGLLVLSSVKGTATSFAGAVQCSSIAHSIDATYRCCARTEVTWRHSSSFQQGERNVLDFMKSWLQCVDFNHLLWRLSIASCRRGKECL